jgi:hypothetical protein
MASRALHTWQMKLLWLVSSRMIWSSQKPRPRNRPSSGAAQLLDPHGHARAAQRANFAAGFASLR